MASPNPAPAQPAPLSADAASTKLRLYTRIYPNRKALFVPADSSRARYFITNPVPHRHASEWQPVFYRGDNPKYSPGTVVTGRARRAALWSSFSLWLGDGVHEVLENKRRKAFKKSVQRKARFRKMFCIKPKPPKGVMEDEQEVRGKIDLVKLHRAGPSRSVEFEVDGERYRWSGTRKLSSRNMKVKGWSHNMKLVRKSDGAIVATFEKSRWASYRSSEKTDVPPNKGKQFVGQLLIYDTDNTQTKQETSTGPQQQGPVNGSRLADMTGRFDDFSGGMHMHTKDKEVNPSGTHAGDWLEEAIALSCWIVVEAEHRIRYKVFDLMQEAGDAAGG